MDKIFTKGLRFVDDKGRVRFFNGMNIDDKLVGQKEFRYPLDEEFFKKYAARGFNFIRLAVTWENLEPKQGEYNESYLKSIDGIFSLAEKYSVYILLDLHQDLYSAFDGKSVGDGAPSWAAITDGAKPKMPHYVWAEGYFWGKWVHRAFDHFWNNDPVYGKGIQDHFAALWQMLAKRYGESPALFGFDLLNEPFPGSDCSKMSLTLIRSAVKEIIFNPKISCHSIIGYALKRDMKSLLGAVRGDAVRDIVSKIDGLITEFDAKKYSPFLNKISEAIREVTPNGIIMIEQSYYCNGGARLSVEPITVKGVRESNQCYGPHAYDMTVDTPLYKYANADRVKAFFNEMHNAQLRLQVPVVVGEWGGCSDNKDTSWFPHAEELLDYFNEKQWGQAYWDYHGDDLDAPLMQMLSRTVPVAVAGNPLKFYLDRESNSFILEYESSSEGDTVVYIHKDAGISGTDNYEIIEDYGSGAKLVSVHTGEGTHTLRIKYR